MRLFEKYRPRTLADCVGQPPVRFLQGIARRPYSCCILLEGPPGCGKTSAAYAMAHELGCYDNDTWPHDNPPPGGMANCTGLFSVTASELTVDAARDLFQHTLRLRFGSSSGFNFLLLEELDRVSANCQTFLKDYLEKKLPRNCIVVACSNGAAGLGKALLQRFKKYHFSGGPTFQQAATTRLQWIWEQETAATLPHGLSDWGWDGDEYSMRVALDTMQDHLSVMEVMV